MLKRLPLILLPLLLLGACANPIVDESASLVGYFKSSYGDGFEVTSNTFTHYDDAAKVVGFAGTFVNAPDLTKTSGTIIIKITNPGQWKKTINTYYAIRWKNLTAKGVQESSASAYPSVTPEPTTQADAETTFAADSYFTIFSDYLRQ